MSFPGFDQLFRAMRREVDHVLSDVPQSLLEARRLIGRELQFEPRPEELQTIVKIAGFVSTSVVCYEMPRQMLALRVLAERVLRNHWSPSGLSLKKLAHTNLLIDELLAAFERSQLDLSAAAEALSQVTADERRFLLHVKDVMLVPKDRLTATTILAPRLELLLEQAAAGKVSETFPGLDREEIEMFDRAAKLGGAAERGPDRACLDAVALRTVYEECDAVWERSGSIEDAERLEQVQQGVRQQLLEADHAYRLVDALLQVRHDEAIEGHLDELATKVRDAKSKLCEAHDKMQPLVQQPQPREESERAARRSLAETLAEAEVADERALSKKKRSQELYRDALTSLRKDRAGERKKKKPPVTGARRARRRRLWILVGTVASLAVAAVAQWMLAKPIPDPVSVSLKEFQPALSVIDAKPIGSMLYVRVTDWEKLSAESTRIRTSEIGELAAAKGLSLVYVVSDTGQGLAEWHEDGGVLVKSRPRTQGDVITQSARQRPE